MNNPCVVCGQPSPDGFLCSPDARKLEKVLAELPAWMDELDTTITRQARAGSRGGKRGKGDELPLPFDWNASDLLWAVRNTLGTWAQHLAESRGAEVVGQPVQFLLANINSIRADEAAGELFAEITGLQPSIERTVDRAEERWYAGPCRSDTLTATEVGGVVTFVPGTCELRLYTLDVDRPIKCDGWRQAGDGCGATHDPRDRRDWVLAHLEDALVRLDEILNALPKLTDSLAPLPDTVKKWRKRGQLQARGVDRSGKELFRGGDVLALVKDEAVRPGPRRKVVAS